MSCFFSWNRHNMVGIAITLLKTRQTRTHINIALSPLYSAFQNRRLTLSFCEEAIPYCHTQEMAKIDKFIEFSHCQVTCQVISYWALKKWVLQRKKKYANSKCVKREIESYEWKVNQASPYTPGKTIILRKRCLSANSLSGWSCFACHVS